MTLFHSEWYGWQNPDWRAGHESPYAHYMAVGRYQNRDPSPMIDMKRYGEVVGESIPPEDRLDAIRRGLRSPAMGVYESWSDLDTVQRDFLNSIVVTRGRDDRAEPRPFLVFLQAGPQSKHREWFDYTHARSWDLLVNYYAADGFDPNLGDVVFFQAGTKFTAVYNILTRCKGLLDPYSYVLLLDDDIMAPMDALDELFSVCSEHDLDLAQMALSRRSSCIWDVLYASGRTGLRHLNCVEIMMPVLSRRAFDEYGHFFGRSVSGFGLDFLLGKKLAKPDFSNIAVVDHLVAEHLKPIDDAAGGYYAYLRSRLINPKAELWRLVEEFDLETTIREAP